MGNYKIFDGTTWVDPCDREVRYVSSTNTFELLDPVNRNIYYFDGNTWLPMNCNCNCPEGSVLNIVTNKCEIFESPVFTGTPQIISPAENVQSYNKYGIKLYNSIGTLSSPTYNLPLVFYNTSAGVRDQSGTVLPVLGTAQSDLWGRDIGSANLSLGRLNNAGVWKTTDTTNVPANEEFSFNVCFNIPQAKEYICAIAADNYVKLEIALNTINTIGPYTTIFDGTTAYTATDCFYSLHAFPVTLPAGNHVIKLTGKNDNTVSQAGLVAEIYDIFLPTFQTTLLNSTNVEADLLPYIYFSSKNLIGIAMAPPETLPEDYSCTNGTLDLCAGVPVCKIETDCI